MKTSISTKKLLFAAFLTAGMFASTAHAGLYQLDQFVDKADLANSGAAETAWLTSLTGITGWAQTPTPDPSVVLFQNPGTTNEWYINVAPATPGYFMLKFGEGGTGISTEHYLFKNLADLTKLVFSNADVDFLTGGCTGFSCNTGRLSHYALPPGSEDPGDPQGVPEPATVALFGLGLMGLLFGRRKFGK